MSLSLDGNVTVDVVYRTILKHMKDMVYHNHRAVAKTLIGGGGCIFIYSGSARLTSFEINFILKETSRAEPQYMNIHPPPPPPQLTL